MEMYEMGKEGRKALGQKAKKYVKEEFSYQKTIDLWHESLTNLVENWRKEKGSKKQWEVHSL
jgi:hypothetical protein